MVLYFTGHILSEIYPFSRLPITAFLDNSSINFYGPPKFLAGNAFASVVAHTQTIFLWPSLVVPITLSVEHCIYLDFNIPFNRFGPYVLEIRADRFWKDLVWQFLHFSQCKYLPKMDIFGEYSHLLNSYATRHCLIKSLFGKVRIIKV